MRWPDGKHMISDVRCARYPVMNGWTEVTRSLTFTSIVDGLYCVDAL